MQGPRVWKFYPEDPSKENKKKVPGTDTHGHAAYACAARVMLKLRTEIDGERDRHLCSTVVAMTWRPPSIDSRTASLISVYECPRTDQSWMQRRQSYCGLDGSRRGRSSVTDRCPSLQLGADTVTAQHDVRLLGVTVCRSAQNLENYWSEIDVTW